MELLVSAPCGEYSGTAITSLGQNKISCRVFKGIRYASAGRFAYPVMANTHKGIYDATRFGPACYQPRSFCDEAKRPEKAFYYREFS